MKVQKSSGAVWYRCLKRGQIDHIASAAHEWMNSGMRLVMNRLGAWETIRLIDGMNDDEGEGLKVPYFLEDTTTGDATIGTPVSLV